MGALSRRQFLAAAGGLATAALVSGCDGVARDLATRVTPSLPRGFKIARGLEVDPDFHFLARATFGPRPGDLDVLAAMGRPAWIEWQLAPAGIDDLACDILINGFETLHAPIGDLFDTPRRLVTAELQRATLIRAVSSQRQLLEVMVEFWSDVFNIDQGKERCAWLKTPDDREVIRPHALGRFRDLVRASATSPAMLVYLDGVANRKDSPAARPNENYARELMELHTLGVHGGYTQADVMEAARALTGWTISDDLFSAGRVDFDARAHDDAPKRVLGVEIPPGLGRGDTDRLVDIVCAHPATATHIATRLARRLVADDPPADLIARTATTFRESEGDIAACVRTIFSSPEFAAARGAKLKRPFRFVVSSLRGLGATTTAGPALLEGLNRMGHLPFAYPTPDGYPDQAAPWLGSFFWRWQAAFALTGGRLDDAGIDLDLEELLAAAGTSNPLDLFAHLVGREPDDSERAAFTAFLGGAADSRRALDEVIGLILASPAFQVA